MRTLPTSAVHTGKIGKGNLFTELLCVKAKVYRKISIVMEVVSKLCSRHTVESQLFFYNLVIQLNVNYFLATDFNALNSTLSQFLNKNCSGASATPSASTPSPNTVTALPLTVPAVQPTTTGRSCAEGHSALAYHLTGLLSDRLHITDHISLYALQAGTGLPISNKISDG